MSKAQTTLVQVTLDLSRTTFSVGETVSSRLHIKNDTATAVEFPGFVFDGQRLAFSGGSAAHLIDPYGQDLMAPYAQLRLGVDGPRSDYWGRLYGVQAIIFRPHGVER